MMVHPALALRDCEHCLQFRYDLEGKVELARKDGQPLRRDGSTPPACQTKEGCPKGTAEQQRTLSPKNLEAWHHYRECRAVGAFPDDPWVRKNARIILDVEEGVRQEREEAFRATLSTLATIAATKLPGV